MDKRGAKDTTLAHTAALAEIHKLAKEHGIDVICFLDRAEMDEFVEDMRRGAYVKAALKHYGVPTERIQLF